MTDLRTSLRRVADAVEPLPVDDDLWQRGVADRRRGQALLVAAALAIVVSVSWSAVVLGDEDREARTASTPLDEGAIPRDIQDIDPNLDLTSDLDVGRASVAFVSPTQDPVVISATDGLPHRLALPGWEPDHQSVALSPDGQRLAWQGADDTETGQATIGVLDLVSGRTEEYPLAPDARLELREMSWSPDSAWLTWLGDSPPSAFAGRLRPGPYATSDHTTLTGNIPDVAVDNDGALVFSRASGGLYRITGRERPVRLTDDIGVGAGRFSPDGRLLALRSAPDPVSYTVDTSTGDVLEHPFPDGTFTEAGVLPQGWLDDRLQLLLVQQADGAGAELVVTTPEVDDTSTWRRRVGSVDASVAGSLSLAVDLVPDLDGTSSQELTYDFPPPAERDISWIIGLGVAAAIAVLMALRWLWRRIWP